MLRSAATKVAWLGRTVSTVLGLAVALALVLGVASTASAANGDNSILGILKNTATSVTKLTGNVAGGPDVQIVNPNPDAGSKALQLGVAEGAGRRSRSTPAPARPPS